MDPNDPTRIQPVAGPPAETPGAWPPPSPGGSWRPGGYDAPPTAVYPAASPPGSPPTGAGPYSAGQGRPSGPSRRLMITGGVLALLLAGLVGFIVGVQVERGRNSSTVAAGSPGSPATTTTTPGGAGQGARAARAARSTTGLVGAVSANGFTISLADGSTTNVVVSRRTRVLTTAQGSIQDVTPGTRVVVVGARNQSGGIAATMVTIGLARGVGAGGRAITTTVP